MKATMTLNIAKDFSKVPAGRYRTDGPFAGQVFREERLVPALAESEVVRVELDGTEGYGSSFLDECFAGLLRQHGFTLSDFERRIVLVSTEDPTLIEEVNGYVADEERRRVRQVHA